MVVGGRLLRTLETCWRRCADRVLRDDYDGWLYAALFALSLCWAKVGARAVLGSRRDCRWRFGCRSRMGRAAANVHLYAGQSAAMPDRMGRRSSPTSFLHTAAVSPVAESARRIRARTGAADRVWRRSDDGDCLRQYSMAGGAAHSAPSAAAPGGLLAAGAAQPQWRATLSLPLRYSALAGDTVVHWRVALAGFSSGALSPIVTNMDVGSGRARKLPLATQGTCACTLAPHLLSRSGRSPAYTNFHFAGDTGDCRRSPTGFRVGSPSDLTTARKVLAIPAALPQIGKS